MSESWVGIGVNEVGIHCADMRGGSFHGTICYKGNVGY